MKILKPPWVNHNGKPIFSIDVHPDGSRFVTAGQGESSGRITIWNVLPLCDVANEQNSGIPKMLCQMDNHFACVNCVRWSHNGTWLASAGDDKLIMIWRYAGGMSKVFGSEQENVETWRCIHTLRGHSGDVLDLSWSPQDKYLATCSVDNTVVVWNAQKFPEQVRVLRGHTSMVKGVTWDPIGKYVATQSDDKTLTVWRTSDWQPEKKVTAPFEEANGTTHVLRLGWSPDGTYLVSAHAMNNMGPTAQIIHRDGWGSDMDFVGHRKAVTCVRFNPKLLKRPIKKKKKNKEEWVKYCCCAVGSRDSSCSIWLTALRRPLVVLHDLFNNSVIDLAWNGKGTQLFLCSSDGTVAFVEFTKEEIGTALAEEEKIIENAELLKLHQQSMSSNISNGTHEQPNGSIALPTPSKPQVNGFHSPEKDSGKSSTNQPTNSPPNTPSKQIETRTKDGRRRITPIFLSPPPAVGDIAPPIFTTTNEISKIVIEHASSDEASMFARPQANDTRSPAAETNKAENKAAAAGSDSGDDTMAIMKPMSSAQAKSSTTPSKTKPSSDEQLQQQTKTKSKPAQASSSKTSIDSAKETVNKIAVKRRAPPPQANKKKKDTAGSDIEPAASARPSQNEPPPAPVSPAEPRLKLPVPEVKKTFSHQISEEDFTVSVTANNNILSAGAPPLSSLQCISRSVTWSAMFSQPIISVAASRYLVCVACKERMLSVFNADGQRILPDIILDSDISHVSVNGRHCMVVTSHCFLSLWDFQSMKCVVKSLDLSHLVSSKGAGTLLSISQCFLSQSNTPCVVLSNSSSYIYHTDLQAWLSFTKIDDIVQQYSNQDTVNNASSANTGPVSSISNKLKNSSTSLNRLYKADSSIHDQCTLTHIQNQMAICRAMSSSSEFRGWLMAYVRYLAEHDDESLLKELCSQCTHTVYKSMRGEQIQTQSNPSIASTSSKSHANNEDGYTISTDHLTTGQSTSPNRTQLMNLDRKLLLRDILPIIGSNLKLQRLYTEYSDLLDIMESGLG